MNDALKRRLVGALVLLAAALIFAFLLPSPGRLAVEEGTRRVTIDLHAPETSVEIAEAARVTPPVIAAPAPAADGAGLQIRSADKLAPRPAAAVTGRPDAFRAPPLQLKSADRLQVVPPPAVAAAPATTPPKAAAKPLPPPVATVAAKPAAPAAAVAAVAPPAPPAAPAKAGARWSVQVGSFSEVGNARQAESRIAAAGLPCTVALIDTPKGKLYRVRIGPLPGEAQAQAAKAKAQQLGFATAAVRQD